MTDSLKVIQPLSEAFLPGGELLLPQEAPLGMHIESSQCLTGEILSGLSLLIILLLFKRIVNLFPSLMACLWRWKECVHLEDSVKLSRNRTLVSIAMLIPFGLIANWYDLYKPQFLHSLSPEQKLWSILGILAGYIILKLFFCICCKPKHDSSKAYTTACMTFATLFILLTFTLLVVCGISKFFDFDQALTRSVMIWISAGIYAICLIRELQIFASYYSILVGFLYLCAAEIIPTGLLVGSIFVF